MSGNKLGHLKHADLRLTTENGGELVIRIDHALVLFVLESMRLDIVPQLLSDFGARHGTLTYDGSEFGAHFHRLHKCRIGHMGMVTDLATSSRVHEPGKSASPAPLIFRTLSRVRLGSHGIFLIVPLGYGRVKRNFEASGKGGPSPRLVRLGRRVVRDDALYYGYILQDRISGRYDTESCLELSTRLTRYEKHPGGLTTKTDDWQLVGYTAFEDVGDASRGEKLVQSSQGGKAFKRIVSGGDKTWKGGRAG